MAWRKSRVRQISAEDCSRILVEKPAGGVPAEALLDPSDAGGGGRHVGGRVDVAGGGVGDALGDERPGGAAGAPAVGAAERAEVDDERDALAELGQLLARAPVRRVPLRVSEDGELAAERHLEEGILEARRNLVGANLEEEGAAVVVAGDLAAPPPGIEDVVPEVLGAEAQADRHAGVSEAGAHLAVGGAHRVELR